MQEANFALRQPLTPLEQHHCDMYHIEPVLVSALAVIHTPIRTMRVAIFALQQS